MTAEECLLYGMLYYTQIDAAAPRNSLEYFHLAITKNSTLGLAYAMAVDSIFIAVSMGAEDKVAEYKSQRDPGRTI